jgi:uroporphyrinogen decarboxylase
MGLEDPNIERLIAAFERKKLDRVPNFEILFDSKIVNNIIELDDSEKNTIQNSFEITDPSKLVELTKKTYQDTIVLDGAYKPVFEDKSVVDITGSISSEEDLEKLAQPEIQPYVIKAKSYIDSVSGTNIGVGLRLSMPLTMAYYMMGPVPIESFMLNIFDNMHFCEAILDRLLEYNMDILESIIGLGFDFVYIDDDVATTDGLFLPPKILEELWVERLKKFLKLVNTAKVPIEFHCCGKLDQVIPILIEQGIDAVNPVQPNCNNIYELKKQFGQDISFVGNIDIGGVLTFGTPKEVIEDTRQHIENLSYNGGYIAASSHSIIDSIPKENYFAMIEATIKYGKF